MKKSISAIMTNCSTLVNSLGDPEIKAGVAPYGFTEERITEIIGQLLTTEELVLKQSKENKDMFVANENFFSAREVVDQDFKNDVKISELAFGSDADLIKIIPSYTDVYPYSDWYKTVTTFYNNLNTVTGALLKVSRFNLTADIIASRISAVKSLDSLYRVRISESGEAQVATEQRDKSIEDLLLACREIKEIAKIAFGKNSQVLEKMGILVRR